MEGLKLSSGCASLLNGPWTSPTIVLFGAVIRPNVEQVWISSPHRTVRSKRSVPSDTHDGGFSGGWACDQALSAFGQVFGAWQRLVCFASTVFVNLVVFLVSADTWLHPWFSPVRANLAFAGARFLAQRPSSLGMRWFYAVCDSLRWKVTAVGSFVAACLVFT